MSRKNQIEEKFNPAKRTLQWKSSLGTFVYYDRNTKENVEVSLPLDFVVLEKDYVSFNGYSDAKSTGFWSNEVKNPNDLVRVMAGDEVVKEFQKKDWNPKDKSKEAAKNDSELEGCNYTQILYVAAQLEGDDKEEIYRIMLSKGAFTGSITVDKKSNQEHPDQELDGWIRFLASLGKGKNTAYNYKFTVGKSKSKKNGAVTFSIPVFSAEPLDESTQEHYTEMASIVDEWFEYYTGKDTLVGERVETLDADYN